MRKSLIALTLLLAVMLSTLGAASAILYGRREQVVFTAAELHGDPAAARGLVVETVSNYDEHLFWTSTVVPGTQPQSQTEYRFVRSDREFQWKNTDPAVALSYSATGGHYYQRPPAEEEDTSLRSFAPLVEELLAEAPPDGEASREIRLADYMECYPLKLHLNFDWGSYWNVITESQEAMERGFRDFFRIPVMGNQFATVEVSKRSNGELWHWKLEGDYSLEYSDNDSAVVIIDGQEVPRREGTDGFQMESKCAEFLDTVYLAFDAHSIRGDLVDTMCIPGGFGIYALPLDRAAMEGEDKYSGILADQLAMVYPLDPEHDVLDLLADPAGERLLLFTREEDVYVFTVIDRASMTARQRIEFPHREGEALRFQSRMEDGYLVAAYGDSGVAVFQPTAGGGWELALTSATRTPDGASCGSLRLDRGRYGPGEAFFAWDGARLAWASPERYGGFALTVFEEGGAAFYAEYGSSLAPAALYPMSEYLNDPDQYEPISVDWVN